jgi:hypothetical protein
MSFEKYNESEQQSLSEKQVQWEMKQEEINKITDALGKEIDEGIKETVIAFNLLGIHTRQSCEGHLDEGVAAPWIDILSPESRKLFPKIEELREKLDTLSEEMSGFEEIEDEYGRTMEEYEKRNLNELKMLLPIL